MSLKMLLVEGPDDVNAIREIATRHFHAQKSSRRAPNPRAAVFDTPRGNRVEVHPVENAKTGLVRTFVSTLRGRAATPAGDPDDLTHVCILYDPDDDQPQNALANAVQKELDRDAGGWACTRAAIPPVDLWAATRGTDEHTELRVVPWLAPGPSVGGLVDVQNLDRLLCQVVSLAYPNELATIDSWLQRVHSCRATTPGLKAPKWKAATLLWAALIDDQAVTDAGIHARFFGQHGACVPHVRAVLAASHLWDEFQALFD